MITYYINIYIYNVYDTQAFSLVVQPEFLFFYIYLMPIIFQLPNPLINRSQYMRNMSFVL